MILCYRKVLTLFFICGVILCCNAQPTVYEIHKEKSKVLFSVTHMGFLKVEGHFSLFSGSLSRNKQGKLMTLESKIAVSSIYTNDKTRDQSLIDKTYLNAEKFPFIFFKSTKIIRKKVSGTIVGVLKIKDVEKEIRMSYTEESREENYIRILALLDRSDFAIDFGALDALVGDQIQVELEIVQK